MSALPDAAFVMFMIGGLFLDVVVLGLVIGMRHEGRKLQAIRELAPELIEWVEEGASWNINECALGGAVERKIRDEADDLVKRFKDLAGVP